MQFRFVALAALAAVGLAISAVSAQQTPPQPGGTPPPPPLPNTNRTPAPVVSVGPANTPPATLPTATAVPSGGPSGAPKRGKGRGGNPAPEASPSETPAPPQFTSLDGTWEIELQPLGSRRAIYQHLRVVQKGSDLSGTWLRDGGTIPFTGTFDGRLFNLDLKDASGRTWTMSGYSDNLDNLVGLLKSSDPKDPGTPFTAQHRKKERSF